MKTTKRRLLSILTIFSTVLLVMFTALWLRTAYNIDVLQSERFGRPWSITSTSGSIELGLSSPAWLQLNPNRPPAGLNWSTITSDKFVSLWPLKPLPGVQRPRMARTATAPNGTIVTLGQTTYHLPYWMLVTVSAILPACWAIAFWHGKRRRHSVGFEVSDPRPSTAA